MSTSNKNTETKQPKNTAEEQRMKSERDTPGTPQATSHSPGRNKTPEDIREEERKAEAKNKGAEASHRAEPTGSRNTMGTKEPGSPNDRANKH